MNIRTSKILHLRAAWQKSRSSHKPPKKKKKHAHTPKHKTPRHQKLSNNKLKKRLWKDNLRVQEKEDEICYCCRHKDCDNKTAHLIFVDARNRSIDRATDQATE